MARKKDSDEEKDDLANDTIFFGTLRSEFDTEAELHESWEALVIAADTVRLAYMRYELTPERTAEIFSKLVLKDTTGTEWTLGATSGDWYQRTMGNAVWNQSLAPANSLPDTREKPLWLELGIQAVLHQKDESETVDNLPEDDANPNDNGDEFDAEAFEELFAPSNQEEVKQEFTELPPEFKPTSSWDVSELMGPVARDGAVSDSDVLGWAPVARDGGPMVPENPEAVGDYVPADIERGKIENKFTYDEFIDELDQKPDVGLVNFSGWLADRDQEDHDQESQDINSRDDMFNSEPDDELDALTMSTELETSEKMYDSEITPSEVETPTSEEKSPEIVPDAEVPVEEPKKENETEEKSQEEAVVVVGDDVVMLPAEALTDTLEVQSDDSEWELPEDLFYQGDD